MKDSSPHVITVKTDGVTRQGFLIGGGAMPVVNIGFYNMPSNALLIAQKPEVGCWYTKLQVIEGQQNLPLWQKIFGGSEFERGFQNQRFDSLWNTCAPLSEPKP